MSQDKPDKPFEPVAFRNAYFPFERIVWPEDLPVPAGHKPVKGANRTFVEFFQGSFYARCPEELAALRALRDRLEPEHIIEDRAPVEDETVCDLCPDFKSANARAMSIHMRRKHTA